MMRTKHSASLKSKLLWGILLFPCLSQAQQTKEVLFIGNSYTYVNDLPQMLKNAALSAGDDVTFDMSAPGGTTFQQHTANLVTLSKIATGNWDYVVLQEQSQWPSFPDGQVETGVFPYAKKLDSLINAQNPCAETVFYMTWGRKNGDAQNCPQWPPVCTYQGMDSLLRLRYTQMANQNQALLSPAGKVWNALRAQYPALELYQTDESHPSAAGTYAAACTFYSVIFRKDPTLITWDGGLGATDAANIRNTAKSVVFNHLANFNVGAFDPTAAFSTAFNGQTATFQNNSQYATTFAWDFGDGTQSAEANPIHTFTGNGPHEVTLVATHCDRSQTVTQTLQIAGIQPLEQDHFRLSPNPGDQQIQITSDKVIAQGTVITLYQTDGKAIVSQSVPTDCFSVNFTVAAIPAGMYFIAVNNNGTVFREKLQVAH